MSKVMLCPSCSCSVVERAGVLCDTDMLWVVRTVRGEQFMNGGGPLTGQVWTGRALPTGPGKLTAARRRHECKRP